MKFGNIIMGIVGVFMAAFAWMIWDMSKGSSTKADGGSIDSSESLRRALSSGQPVLLEFYADWCGPCKSVGPVVDAFAREITGKAKVVRLNVDMVSTVADTYKVRSIPTFIAFDKSGRETSRHSGVIPKERMSQMLGL